MCRQTKYVQQINRTATDESLNDYSTRQKRAGKV